MRGYHVALPPPPSLLAPDHPKGRSYRSPISTTRPIPRRSEIDPFLRSPPLPSHSRPDDVGVRHSRLEVALEPVSIRTFRKSPAAHPCGNGTTLLTLPKPMHPPSSRCTHARRVSVRRETHRIFLAKTKKKKRNEKKKKQITVSRRFLSSERVLLNGPINITESISICRLYLEHV